VPIAQAWALISTYEAKKTFFTRAWMSSGRLTRLCLMLSLHLLDGKTTAIKQILPPPKDWIELEERRRTFWSAFYCDRWASSGTGWVSFRLFYLSALVWSLGAVAKKKLAHAYL